MAPSVFANRAEFVQPERREEHVYFFYETSLTIATSTPVGQWDLSGFSQVAMHMWANGPGGAKVYPELADYVDRRYILVSDMS